MDATGNTIGGTAAGAGNLIAGTDNGVELDGGNGTLVVGNVIGTDFSGAVAIANYTGVLIDSSGVLPEGQSTNNTIGGSTQGSGNLISGNTTYGVRTAEETTDDLIEGNKIGTDVTGTLALPNATGIFVQGLGDTIGGTVSGDSNVISGNTGVGIYLFSLTSTDTTIVGNKIGTDVTGTLGLPNSDGIDVESYDNTIGGSTAGAGNVIAFNTDNAIRVFMGTGNAILENLVYANGAGIVLTSGGNDDQIAPLITGVTTEAMVDAAAEITISVDLTASGFTPGATYSLDFFADSSNDPAGGDEAHYYLGTQTFTGGTTGNVTFTSSLTPLFTDQTVTATATLLSGSTYTDTSAFAAASTVTELSDFIVTTTAATGAGSLEQAILDANADTSDPSAYVILFGITTGSAPTSSTRYRRD